MQSVELYNLSPVLRVMLLGLAIACGPLSWVWLRNRQASGPRRLATLTLITLFLTFDLVMFGAFTRLTDSGLGCPDWPGCYGEASPMAAHAEITLAQQQMPTGPVTHTKAWIEMLHRYFATAVGVLILTLAVATWAQRRTAQGVTPWLPVFTLVWVCVQGAFGALTVTMKLFPAIVTLHLLGGLILLSLLMLQAAAYRTAPPAAIPPRDRRWLWAAFALLWLQAALGAWVSTNYAVLACSEFPKCQGSWWPAMDFAQGFELWRDLGKTGAGAHIDFAALTAIHYTHRLVAYGLFAVLGVAAWKLWRGPLAVQARWIAGLAALQFATGVSNVVLDWPLAAAVMHTGGAAALVVVLTWALRESRPS
jgi:heme a synthase